MIEPILFLEILLVLTGFMTNEVCLYPCPKPINAIGLIWLWVQIIHPKNDVCLNGKLGSNYMVPKKSMIYKSWIFWVANFDVFFLPTLVPINFTPPLRAQDLTLFLVWDEESEEHLDSTILTNTHTAVDEDQPRRRSKKPSSDSEDLIGFEMGVVCPTKKIY